MSTATLPVQPVTVRAQANWTTRHWFLIFIAAYGLWVWLPFLAPVLMHAGWTGAGGTIYLFYSFFCHQLPERSYFLFGRLPMYSLTDIQATWRSTESPLLLRQFTGNTSMGWKVAWSDRMISFYTSVWAFGLLWRPVRRRVPPLPWWGVVLFLIPIILDGGSHAISDLAGIGQGFRDSNQWLVMLTNDALPAFAYAGDALGSFNSWMRIATGILAGLGLAWFLYPQMEAAFGEN